MSDIVILNVGGKEMMCSKATMKIGMIDLVKNWKPFDVRNGVPIYFFDRDPYYFDVILTYLRTGKVIKKGNMNENLLWAEFNYWGIDLVKPIDVGEKEWKMVREFCQQVTLQIASFLQGGNECPDYFIVPPLGLSEKFHSFLGKHPKDLIRITDPILRDIYISIIAQYDIVDDFDLDTEYPISQDIQEVVQQSIKEILSDITICNTKYFLPLLRYYFSVSHNLDLQVFEQSKLGMLLEETHSQVFEYEHFLPNAWWYSETYIETTVDYLFEYYKTCNSLRVIQLKDINCLCQVETKPLQIQPKKYTTFLDFDE